MSANSTDAILIARRYATAIFSQALETQKESSVVAAFSALAGAIESDAALARALANPLVTRSQKEAVVIGLLKGADALAQRAASVVAQSGRSELFVLISTLLSEQLARHRGERSAVVTSARPLPPATQKQLKESLSKATGKETHVSFAENPELLGGLVVELGSLRLDASLSGALHQMRAALTAPAA